MTKQKLFPFSIVYALLFLFMALCLQVSCRGPQIIIDPESEQKGDTLPPTDTTHGQICGFYLLNEGNMGANKASLDYYDYTTATYTRNIYAAANPTMVQALGDVGNDLALYGSKLYAVINCSNLVEVMDAATAAHLGTIECPNCRYLAFHGPYGYITSYAGPVSFEHYQRGCVIRFDTASLAVIDTCFVGYQPDGLAIVDSLLFVANSGGYLPTYERHVSVIDLNRFVQQDSIIIAPNLDQVTTDRYGQLWVSSRGNYYDIPSRLYCVDGRTRSVIDSINTPVTRMWLDGDNLYVYGAQFDYTTYETHNTYRIIDVASHQIITDNFIHNLSSQITTPYGLAVHPDTKEIYITDATDYVSPGTLWCIAPDGKVRWSVTTGDIPSRFAFRRNHHK